MLTSFRQFIEDNKDEIEALQGPVQPTVPGRAAVWPGQGTGGGDPTAAALAAPRNGSGRPTKRSSRTR